MWPRDTIQKPYGVKLRYRTAGELQRPEYARGNNTRNEAAPNVFEYSLIAFTAGGHCYPHSTTRADPEYCYR